MGGMDPDAARARDEPSGCAFVRATVRTVGPVARPAPGQHPVPCGATGPILLYANGCVATALAVWNHANACTATDLTTVSGRSPPRQGVPAARAVDDNRPSAPRLKRIKGAIALCAGHGLTLRMADRRFPLPWVDTGAYADPQSRPPAALQPVRGLTTCAPRLPPVSGASWMAPRPTPAPSQSGRASRRQPRLERRRACWTGGAGIAGLPSARGASTGELGADRCRRAWTPLPGPRRLVPLPSFS
jgi:hypothetical protein